MSPVQAPKQSAAEARWWGQLGPKTRLYLMTCRRGDPLPLEIWQTCIAYADAQDLARHFDRSTDARERRLPDSLAAYVDTLRGAPRRSPGASP